MKRKRGHRGGYTKGKRMKIEKDAPAASVPMDTEDSTSLDQTNDDQLTREDNSAPASVGSDKFSMLSELATEDKSTGKAGRGRVKVKLRSSRVLETLKSSSDVQTPSETDKSNPQVKLEINERSAEKEENAYSDGQTSELQNAILEKLPRKTASIKIKSSKILGFPKENMQDKKLDKLSVTLPLQSEKKLVSADSARTSDSSALKSLNQKEEKSPYSDSHYSEKELSAALAVIKKVMKMDAAGPFNTPVDPVALGIPDYFDIIDTPMDFGTICHNLEHGSKYMSSEDVYKDVQYIWDNCYRYNNKGDYVVDLMKRVKKNFIKYWLAAGLYSDIPAASDGTPTEDASHFIQEKTSTKGKKHKRRRFAIDRHKSDCLCAVCAVRRRRKEREENSPVVDSQTSNINSNFCAETNQEENSPLDISCSEDATSSLNRSVENDANADMEEAENEENMETSDQLNTIEPGQQGSGDVEFNEGGVNDQGSLFLRIGKETNETRQKLQDQDMEITEPGDTRDDIVLLKEEKMAPQNKDVIKKLDDSSNRSQMNKIEDYPVQQENHSVLQICRSLFPSDPRSVWNSPHSLSRRIDSVRDSAIHAAVAALMKQ